MKKRSVKYERMNDEVMREISRILARDIHDPRIHPMTSVLSADVSPDLHTAKIFVSVFGSEEERKKTAQGLKSAAPAIRRKLAKNMNMRNTPELSFVVDDTLEYEAAMAARIAQVSEELKASDEKIKEEDVFDSDDDYIYSDEEYTDEYISSDEDEEFDDSDDEE
ncbi:MAG: 30S ribosome-binding factor RbfA [Lachnospiraceae bacterium]|nr:30S ribosome-binding factor RbfA [Lachnospiraceae bacterium]